MDAAEAAGYLHWPEEALTEETLDLLRKIGGKLEREAEPRLVYRIFGRTEDGCEGLCLPGEDIRTLLGTPNGSSSPPAPWGRPHRGSSGAPS